MSQLYAVCRSPGRMSRTDIFSVGGGIGRREKRSPGRRFVRLVREGLHMLRDDVMVSIGWFDGTVSL